MKPPLKLTSTTRELAEGDELGRRGSTHLESVRPAGGRALSAQRPEHHGAGWLRGRGASPVLAAILQNTSSVAVVINGSRLIL
jgi:hypothetical protein